MVTVTLYIATHLTDKIFLLCLFILQGHPMARFGNSCSEGLKSPETLDLIAVKAGDFFGETPRTFVTRELISSYCFRRAKCVF